MMAFSSVVLPAPLAPMMVTISLSATSSDTDADGLDLAVGDMGIGNPEQRCAHATAPR